MLDGDSSTDAATAVNRLRGQALQRLNGIPAQAPPRAQCSNREKDSENRSERDPMLDNDADAITAQRRRTAWLAARGMEIHPCASPLHTTSSDGEEDSKLQPSVEGTSNGDGKHDRIPDNHADPSMVRALTHDTTCDE